MTRTMIAGFLPLMLGLAACDAAVDSFNAVGEGIKRDRAAQATMEAMSPAQIAFSEANARMHAGMGTSIDEDADIAFMQGMIPHHQGAIDMANAVLEYGDDAEAKALARRVIAAQSEEIAEIRAWLERHGRGVTTTDPVDHEDMGH